MKKLLSAALILLTVIWMAVIFSFSCENGGESAESSGGFIRYFLDTFSPEFGELSSSEQQAVIESYDHFIRKAAHFTIYAVLGSLIFSAVKSFGIRDKNSYFISLISGAAYAVSDEIHQYFVPGRACMLRDMLLDSCGVAFGAAVILLIIRLLSKLMKKTT
ncbi:MAG: VanZ family protein [Eubacteriales bacterium]